VAARLDADEATTTERLHALRRDFSGVVAASADSNADDEHDPEGATIAFERSQVAALIQQAERHLADISAARSRLEAGVYGRCERCGQQISLARLEARPTARACVGCA
jgi:RNA polymerase-binding transcription factor DksA